MATGSQSANRSPLRYCQGAETTRLAMATIRSFSSSQRFQQITRAEGFHKLVLKCQKSGAVTLPAPSASTPQRKLHAYSKVSRLDDRGSFDIELSLTFCCVSRFRFNIFMAVAKLSARGSYQMCKTGGRNLHVILPRSSYKVGILSKLVLI